MKPHRNGTNGIGVLNGQAKRPPRFSPPPSTPFVDGTETKPKEEVKAFDGRDTGGKFTAGNHHGKGNPFARKTAKLRAALLEAVTETDLQDLAKKLLTMAKHGNLPAAKLLLAYTVGKPFKGADPDTLDIDELDMRRRWPDFEEAASMVFNIPAEIVNQKISDIRCMMQKIFAHGLAGLFGQVTQGLRRGDSSQLETLQAQAKAATTCKKK